MKVNQNTMTETETKAYDKEPRAHINCTGVKLGTQSLNCLMYAGNPLVISNSLEGLQQSLAPDYLW